MYGSTSGTAFSQNTTPELELIVIPGGPLRSAQSRIGFMHVGAVSTGVGPV